MMSHFPHSLISISSCSHAGGQLCGCGQPTLSSFLCFSAIVKTLYSKLLCTFPLLCCVGIKTIYCFIYIYVHLLFSFDLDLHLTCFCFIHVHQHAPPLIAGAGHLCYDSSLFACMLYHCTCMWKLLSISIYLDLSLLTDRPI